MRGGHQVQKAVVNHAIDS